MTDVVSMPPKIAKLPRDKHDRPVPWFVEWVKGQPEFRLMNPEKLVDAHRFGLCWICGQRRGRNVAFVIGPMCAVNRVSAEPPSHVDCADYSAQVCPFLTTPKMVRRERGLPENVQHPAGEMIRRNPGVALVWLTRRYERFTAPGGHLFYVGEPTEVRWYAEGRPATRAEVLESIDSGLPTLRGLAEQDGRRAVAQLDAMHSRALTLVPAA